jgi:ParB-like chromosome segregation protein Spo0J
MIEQILLEQIDGNPWQPRTSVDREGIAELALSIARDGLLQTPVGRRNSYPGETGAAYQLALGHRRLLAYRLLASIQAGLTDGNRPELVDEVQRAVAAGGSFEAMPLDIQQLSDREMFEVAVSENLQRKDLNPIEQASAEKRYMDEFGATSEEAGRFFGVSAATIRGKVRLLDLPQEAQEKLASGEMSEGMARTLLTIQRAAGEEQVEQAIKAILLPNADIERVVNRALIQNEKSIEMWQSWRDDEVPLAGTGLWPLSMPGKEFPNNRLPELTHKDALKALGMDELPDNFDDLLLALNYGSEVPEGWNETIVEHLRCLIEPPGCTTCNYYARIVKAHYCTFRACRERKIKAWCRAELETLSQSTGLPVYDRQLHGKEIVVLKEAWGEEGKKLQAIYDAKKDVCLQPHYTSSQYGSPKHPFTGSYLVRAVLTGATVHNLAERQKKAAARSKEKEKSSLRKWKIVNACRQAADSFLDQVAAPVFAQAFGGMAHIGAMQALVGHAYDLAYDKQEKTSRGKNIERLRILLARKALGNDLDWELKERGPLAVAAFLQPIATTWGGVELPEDWLDLAKPYCEGLEEYEGLDGKTVIVSAETDSQEA